jgi:phage N-6-adenine-methyltransferase
MTNNRDHTIRVIGASNENEWYTPTKYIEAAKAVLGTIDLDPASSAAANEVVGAAKYYTQEDDGLSQSWAGRVWMNPPYGRLAGKFVAKLIGEYQAGNVTEAIILLNANSNDAKWFQPLWNHTLCFVKGRIDFNSNGREKKSSSTHASVIAYLGPNAEKFKDHFSQFGTVLRRFKQPERQPLTPLEFYNKALDNPGNNRGGATITGSKGGSKPRSKAKTRTRNQDDFDYASDKSAYSAWMANDMPGPEGYTSWMSISMMPRDMTRYAYELSLNKVEEMLRELEPDERQLIETCMAFKGNDVQAAKYLGLPERTYRYRLDKAREHAKEVLVKFYQWGDEPSQYTDKLNVTRRELGEHEFRVNTKRLEAIKLKNQFGAREAAKRLAVSRRTLYRMLEAA